MGLLSTINLTENDAFCHLVAAEGRAKNSVSLWLYLHLPHAALLVFFAAAARAGIVAADAGFAVTDRFELLAGLGAGDRRLLLAFNVAGGRSIFFDRRRFDHRAADKSLV